MFEPQVTPSFPNELWKLWDRVYKPKKKSSIPSILVPTCPKLRVTGYRRPLWLSLIAFFFSPKFALDAIHSAFWPFSLNVPRHHLPHLLASFVVAFTFESLRHLEI